MKKTREGEREGFFSFTKIMTMVSRDKKHQYLVNIK